MKHIFYSLFVFLFLIVNNLYPQSTSSSIKNLHINCFCQDQFGFVWIGTAKGLYKYDGYEYKCYIGNYADTTNVLGDVIFDMCADWQNNIWLSTNNGLTKYDYKKDTFININKNIYCKKIYLINGKIYYSSTKGLYKINEDDNIVNTLPILNNEIVHSIISWNGNIWIGCQIDSKFYIYIYDNTFTELINKCEINTLPKIMYGLENSKMLIGSQKGLTIWSLNPIREEMIFSSNISEYLQKMDITLIEKYGDFGILIGTANKGLYIYNIEKQVLSPINDQINGTNISSLHITSTLIDKAGNLWVGSFDKGYFLIKQNAIHFNKDKLLHEAFYGNFVSALAEDNNFLWVGTRTLGLGRYNKLTNELFYYNKTNSNLFDLANTNFVQTLLLDSKGHLWIGTDSHLSLCNINTGKIEILKTYNIRVVCITEDNLGQIWLGTSSNGIVKIKDLESLPLYIKNQDIINIPKIIPFDNQNMVLSSYSNGIYLLDIRTNNISKINMPDESKKLSQKVIELYMDKDSILWLGTYGYGLAYYNHKNNDYKSFSYNDGLSSNDILAIQEDEKGDLWFSTSWGLSKMDKRMGTVLNFFDYNGTNGNQYHEKCSLKDHNNVIYFSGNHGLTFFNPSDIIINNVAHPVIITGLKILNEQVETSDKNGVIEENISYVSSMKLDHLHNTFSIDYTAINFDNPQKINYAYKLEGFDKDWNYVGNFRRAAYSNVPAGNYKFMVQAQNDDGTWSNTNVTTIDIRVMESPWLSWWAISTYCLISLLVLFILIRMYIHNKLSDERLVLLEREKRHEREVMQMKMNFLGNISHEIRTPLTLIYGCINLLKGECEYSEKNKLISLVNYNMQRLLRLLNQMMEYSKLEKETLPLKVDKIDIIALVENLLHSYEYYVKEKNIKITLRTKLENNTIFADPDKLDKILNNLISNAVKYTPDNGNISVEISEYNLSMNKFKVSNDTNYIMFSVKDTGVGVSEDDIPHLFDRFTRFKSTINKTSIDGFGVGLHYVKKLVETHKGEIIANRNIPSGMDFSFIIPISDDSYKQSEHKNVNEITIINSSNESQEETNINPSSELSEKITILVVDDNIEVLFFISKILSDKKFNILTANNGVEGFDKAKEVIPDIILSDVLMPQMDGYEFCKKIRNDSDLSHIPIILLTAKVSKEDYISGYNAGATIFVEKPFYPEVLLSQIDNVLRFRKVLQQKIQNSSQNDEVLPDNKEKDSLELNILDRRFLDNLHNYIEKELDNEFLSVDKLGRDLGFSRTSFYRKMINLVGQTPNDFIRTYRLKRAKELICSGEFTLSEIATKTGFGTYSNFSVRFKKMYGVSPREFKQETI